MCLIKTHRFPKISRKPIKCYKRVNYLGDNNYKSEFIGYHFKLGDVIKNTRHWLFAIFNDKLTDEVVHSFNFNGKSIFDESDECWIECKIPAFTPYWTDNYGCIGAARIRTIKEV